MDRKIRQLKEEKRMILEYIKDCKIVTIKAELAEKLVLIEQEIEKEEKKNLRLIQELLKNVY